MYSRVISARLGDEWHAAEQEPNNGAVAVAPNLALGHDAEARFSPSADQVTSALNLRTRGIEGPSDQVGHSVHRWTNDSKWPRKERRLDGVVLGGAWLRLRLGDEIGRDWASYWAAQVEIGRRDKAPRTSHGCTASGCVSVCVMAMDSCREAFLWHR